MAGFAVRRPSTGCRVEWRGKTGERSTANSRSVELELKNLHDLYVAFLPTRQDQWSRRASRGDWLRLQSPKVDWKNPSNWTYLWVEVNDWPRWEEKFIYGPYIHHCTVVHGRLAPVLYEACKYIPGVEPDLLDPTEEEIRAYRRGQDLTNGGE